MAALVDQWSRMGAVTPEERAAAGALIASERDRLAALVLGLVAEHEAIVEASESANLDDEHDPEGATVGFERARVASLLRDARRRLSEADEAAERLRTGGYGHCDHCGEPIAGARLTAHPTAKACVSCAGTPGSSPLHRW